MSQSTTELTYLIQFLHPEKNLARLPGVTDEVIAAMHQTDVETFRNIRAGFAENAKQAALELLEDQSVTALVDQLPFQPGDVVVALGDSITDDYQSWCEILRNLLVMRRREEEITLINAGISGDTTSQMLTRFLGVVETKPNYIICMAGTNDARTHGQQPTKTLVSLEETELNYAALRNYAATQTEAEWIWMTPATVIEEKIRKSPFLGAFEMHWSNENLAAIAEVASKQSDPCVDLQAVFGDPADSALLMEDGLHPNLAGQKAIVRALLAMLAEI